jgi:hypothetical protein
MTEQEPEQGPAIAITYVSESGELDAVVRDSGKLPWSIVETKPEPLVWTTIMHVVLSDDAAPRYFAFESDDVAREWAARHGIREIAQGLDPDSASKLPKESAS